MASKEASVEQIEFLKNTAFQLGYFVSRGMPGSFSDYSAVEADYCLCIDLLPSEVSLQIDLMIEKMAGSYLNIQ